MRAVDGWDSVAFSGFYYLRVLSAPKHYLTRPPATNARRWKAKAMSPYSIIYADPAWRMNGNHGELNPAYLTMSDDEIVNLPVAPIACDNSVLLMWVISSKMDVAIQACKAWGFTYKTIAFVWVKTSKKTGMPNCRLNSYTLSAVEVCILAMRGKLPKKSHKVKQVIMSPRERHSKKPDEIRNRIVELFGDLPRIELFARQRVAGWDVFGNEVEGSIRLPTHS